MEGDRTAVAATGRCGRTRETDLREVVDSIFYIAQTGCQWRLLPKDFPSFTTVQRYFYAWRDDGRWQIIYHVLLMDVREAAGREGLQPRALSLADTIGLLVGAIVHPANCTGP